MKQRRPIKYGDVVQRVIHDHTSLREISKDYGISLTRFKVILSDNLGTNIWRQVIAADEENEKLLRRQRKRLIAKRSKQQKIEQEESENTTQKNNELERLCEKHAAVKAGLQIIERKLEKAEEVKTLCFIELQKAEKEFEIAKRSFYEAKKRFKKTDNAFSDIFEQLQESKKNQEEIERQIEELSVYLVAPNFHGTIPESGTCISTVKMDGVDRMIPTGEYYLAPEYDEMEELGYSSLDEYLEDLKFIMLCTEFIIDEKPLKVLTDSERILQLINNYIGGEVEVVQ